MKPGVLNYSAAFVLLCIAGWFRKCSFRYHRPAPNIGLAQFGLSGSNISHKPLLCFSYGADRSLILFLLKRKFRSFNVVRHRADGILIPKLRQAVDVIRKPKSSFRFLFCFAVRQFSFGIFSVMNVPEFLGKK